MSFIKNLFASKTDSDGPKRQKEQAEQEERQTMIEGIGELENKTVKEVMVPRIDVQFIPVNISHDAFFSIIHESGFSRYPVYEKSIDNIVGVLYAKDILRQGTDRPFSVRSLMRKPYFVPESKRLDDLLREFKRRKVHIAIAVDEYGGVSGIVCMEDILEVIVGEIQDEFDADEPEDISKIGEGVYIIDSRTPIEQVNDELDLSLADEDNETIGGYVFELFGRIPAKGESIEDREAVFTVVNIEGHKILSVKVVKKQSQR
ncbi:MAG: hemolysin family protein [Sphaerochaetaceae bacterium]